MGITANRVKQLQIRDAELAAQLKRNAAAGKALRAERTSIKAELESAPAEVQSDGDGEGAED